MGLGPPVCYECRTVALYEKDRNYWCPSCGNTDLLKGLWEFDINMQEEMWNNHRFWIAIKEGKDMIEEKRMITERQGEGKIDIDADIAYFKNKIAHGVANGEDVTKLREQLEMLEDSLVVYRLTTPPRGSDGANVSSVEKKHLNEGIKR